MQLNRLIDKLEIKQIIGSIDVDVTSIKMVDTEVDRGSLYFCIKGEQFDGHDFALEAESRGCVAIICERKIENASITQVIVNSSRIAMSIVASEFYDNPSKKLKLIGVTGTNGKTTTCHLIRNILELSGKQTGVIGTLGVSYKNVEIAPSLTTPDPIFLHKVFSDMVMAGVEYVVMEVSAHAVWLDKIAGLTFEVGVFTNLTQDHLDFFGDMKTYSLAKEKYLSEKYCKFLVFNTDDETGRRLFLSSGKKCASFGVNEPSDVFAVNIKEELTGISFVINLFDNIYNVKCNMTGLFSVYNCLASATCCAVLGVKFDDVINGIAKTEGVKGRVEFVKNNQNKRIFIDYAHTPDGLKNVISSLKKCVKGRLICLFGCGGNRDKSKRADMGRIAGELADFCVITSDNPRYEEPVSIIIDIEKGLRQKSDKYVTIQDRAKAISYAISYMKPDDVLLIAGKGAEEYQEVMGVRHCFSDKRYVLEQLGGKKE